MKKILVLAGCLVLCVAVLCGCGVPGGSAFGCGGVTVDPIVTKKPWSNNNNYEYIEYSVQRYYTETTDDGEAYKLGGVEAEGTYSTTMYTIASNIYEWSKWDSLLVSNARLGGYFKDNLATGGKLVSTPGAYGLLVTDYSLTYADGSDYAGKTDSIYSVVLFEYGSLEPVYSEKIAAYSTSDNSYTAVADYVEGRNILTAEGQDAVETKITASGSVYDNELLYYLLRASSSMSLGGSGTFTMHNAVYGGLNGAQSERSMGFSVASASATIEGLDPDDEWLVPTYFDDGDVTYYDGQNDEHEKGYALPAYATTVQLNSQEPGSARHMLYYSAAAFNCIGSVTSNVLLRSVDTESDNDGIVRRANVATISDYKISELM